MSVTAIKGKSVISTKEISKIFIRTDKIIIAFLEIKSCMFSFEKNTSDTTHGFIHLASKH